MTMVIDFGGVDMGTGKFRQMFECGVLRATALHKS